MLARLRHDALVRSDNQEHQVDSVSASQHILYKALVARNIDESDAHVAEIKVGKTNINCDSATLLFRKPIGIDARQ